MQCCICTPVLRLCALAAFNVGASLVLYTLPGSTCVCSAPPLHDTVSGSKACKTGHYVGDSSLAYTSPHSPHNPAATHLSCWLRRTYHESSKASKPLAAAHAS